MLSWVELSNIWVDSFFDTKWLSNLTGPTYLNKTLLNAPFYAAIHGIELPNTSALKTAVQLLAKGNWIALEIVYI